MKVRLSRLARLITPLGFVHDPRFDDASFAFFVRVIRGVAETQWINISWAGKRNEAFAAYVGVGVTKCLANVKGLVESHVLFDVAENKTRAQTIIETDEKARAWEEEVARVAPPLAESFAAQEGPDLLTRTEPIRVAAQAYLARIYQLTPSKDRLCALRHIASREMIAEAERLAELPWVLRAVGAEDIYLLACLAITLFAPQVEAGGKSFFGQNPRDNDGELMLRIQLVADELLFETWRISKDS